jgi:hypothetical protein
VDGLHHQLEHWVEDLPGFLRIAIGQKLHRALQVGEEDRYLLPLAFERRFGVDDPLGQVLGGIRLRCGEARLTRSLQWGRALPTEPIFSGVRDAT